MTSVFHNILRTVAGSMELPVVIVLIAFLAFAVFTIGWLAAEWVTEHRHLDMNLPKLLDQLQEAGGSPENTISGSGLLKRQKALLLELTRHPALSPDMRAEMADSLVETEYARYDRITKLTDLVSKLSPMFGLLGTLIPLGPGIMALGQGDTYTLSASLLTAFDTTIAGLLAAAVCLVVSTIRKRWYASYMNGLEALVKCVLEGLGT